MDNDSEVVCTGDLHKKNLTGFKTWNLRRFALIHNFMVYYKEGVKRGEWDISGCKVKTMTAEECHEPAAKFAFCLENSKKQQFLFSASNEKTREQWMSIIKNQIEEFKNPIRKFIKRGEFVLGTGIVKRKNLFGKVSNTFVVTNFPRLLIIDPLTNQLKDQINWVKGQSTFSKIDNIKFKIIVNGKEIIIDESVNGTVYWEKVFQTLQTMTSQQFYSPKKNEIVRVGAPTPVAAFVGEKRTEVNLQFLEQASESIDRLLMSVSAKISVLETMLAESMKSQHKWKDADQESYENGLIKRTQMQMLRENVELIAINLEKLTVQCKTATTAISFDRIAIQSVIEEAGTLLSLLMQEDFADEDEDDDDDVQSMRDNNHMFGAEVQNIDNMIAQQDDDYLATEEMIANIEFLSLFSDDSIDKLNEKFDRLNVDSAVNMKVTKDNFNPEDITLRPPLWKEIRTKRLLIQEYVMKLEGVMEDTIVENRKQSLATEEVRMVQEVSTYGRLLNLAALVGKGGIERAAMFVTQDNFDPHSNDLRPPAWRPIRLRRVMVKEDFTASATSGTNNPQQSLSEAELARSRPRRVVEEEQIMLQEVIKHKQVLTFGRPSDNPVRTQTFMQSDSIGNEVVRERANTIRERANTMRDRAYTIRDKENVSGGRTRVPSSVPVYQPRSRGMSNATAAGMSSSSNVSSDSFDPDNEEIRPEGWLELRMKRVQQKEEIDRVAGVSEETIILNRKKRLQQEEALMIKELMNDGKVVGYAKNIKIVNESHSHSTVTVPSTATTVSTRKTDASTIDDEEFNKILMKRILTLEQRDREKGVDEETIYFQRKLREETETKLMREEIMKHGKLITGGSGSSSTAGSGGGGRRRANTMLQDAHMIEIDHDNFDIADPNKRPQVWSEIKAKRVMVKEHIDRIGGVLEHSIVELRPLRSLEEEMNMVSEIVCFGRLLSVGESFKPSDEIAVSLDINNNTFHATDSTKRPTGWVEVRQQRIAMKCLEEKLHKIKPTDTAQQREQQEEAAMVQEAVSLNHVSLLGKRISFSTAAALSARDNATPGTSGNKPSPRKLPGQSQSAADMEDYEKRKAELKRVEQGLEVLAGEYDPAHPEQKPAGWAEIKLRKVYLKEWQDRKDGLDDEDIMAKRYERELEVEEEMIQALTVLGRIRLFENKIKANRTAAAASIVKKNNLRASSNGGGIHSQISASSMSIEMLAGRLGELSATNSSNSNSNNNNNLPKPPPPPPARVKTNI